MWIPIEVAPLDPDPYQEYGYGSRTVKMRSKKEKSPRFQAVLDSDPAIWQYSDPDSGAPITYGSNWIRIQMQVFTRHKKMLNDFLLLQSSVFFHTFLLIRKKLLQKTMKILIKSDKNWNNLQIVISYQGIQLLDLDPDPDPYTIYGSGSRRAKNIRIQLDPDTDPQHWFQVIKSFDHFSEGLMVLTWAWESSINVFKAIREINNFHLKIFFVQFGHKKNLDPNPDPKPEPDPD